jgi:hypothetical protein
VLGFLILFKSISGSVLKIKNPPGYRVGLEECLIASLPTRRSTHTTSSAGVGGTKHYR